jgi:hypothetical protein
MRNTLVRRLAVTSSFTTGKNNVRIPEQLLHEIEYNSRTGQLFWKISRGKRKAGSIAGNVHKDRIRIKYMYKYYFAHRVIWAKVYGDIPDNVEIDHIDLNTRNNKLINLRLATHSQNGMNRRKQSNSEPNPKGVYFHKRRGYWVAQIVKDRENTYLGHFDTAAEAHRAYVAAAATMHGQFARAA